MNQSEDTNPSENQPETTGDSGRETDGAGSDELDLADIGLPTTPPPASAAEIDLEAIRLPQDYGDEAVREVVTAVTVGKPPKGAFIRTHPDPAYRLNVAMIEPEPHEYYLVDNKMAAELLATEPLCGKFCLWMAVTKEGEVFLWPMKLSREGAANSWNDSAMAGGVKGMEKWVRVTPDQSMQRYRVQVALNNSQEPRWPEETLAQLITAAFRGRLIATPDHPVLRRLRGED